MKVGKSLRTVLIVTVITAIVWIVADRSVLRTTGLITVDVVVRCSDAGYRVTIVEPAEEAKTMKVTFAGPSRGIDRLTAQMDTDQRIKWEYVLSAKDAERAAATATPLVIPAREGFARATDELRVTLAESDTPQVTVRVETLLQKSLPVQLSPGDRKLVTPDFKIVPPEVEVTGTENDFADLIAGIIAEVDLKSPVLLAGKTDEQIVAVRPGRDLPVVLKPKTVVVRNLRLTQSLVEQTLDFAVLITIDAPLSIINTYHIELESEEITNLRVRAPAGVQLNASDIKAVVPLTADTKETGEKAPMAKAVEITFPKHPQVTLVDSPPSATVTVKKRKSEIPE